MHAYLLSYSFKIIKEHLSLIQSGLSESTVNTYKEEI